MEKFSLPADSRTTDWGIVIRAVATQRAMSSPEGGLLDSMGVPAGATDMELQYAEQLSWQVLI